MENILLPSRCLCSAKLAGGVCIINVSASENNSSYINGEMLRMMDGKTSVGENCNFGSRAVYQGIMTTRVTLMGMTAIA